MTIRYAYDFETYEWVKPLCCAIVGPSVETFIYRKNEPSAVAYRTLKHMSSIVLGNKLTGEDKVQFWAHNGGKFDALLLIECAANEGWKVDAAPAAGRLVRTIITVDGARIELLDSYAVVQASLQKAAEGFECPSRKLFAKFDYDRDMRQLPLAKLKAGCVADCKIVLELLDRVESHLQALGGELKATFSSSAFSCLKAKLPESVPYPTHQGNQWANEISRRAYMGGRVEVFHHSPQSPVEVYDVNSSYPWSMTQPLPWELRGMTEDNPRAAGDILEAQSGMVYARVTVPECHIPVLPYRPDSGGMYFPTGRWSAWFTAVELVHAISASGVHVEPMEGIYYNMRTPFKEYIAGLYKLKCEGTGAKKTFGKLALNGSYGKMGMKPERDKLLVFATEEEGLAYEVEHGTTRLNKDSKRFQQQNIFHWPKSTHYAMAAHVTAYSRIKLHQYLTRVLVQAAYCDTDSIHDYSEAHGLRDACNTKLGALKDEGTFHRARYYAPKLYMMQAKPKLSDDDKYKAKGFEVAAAEFKHLTAGGLIPAPRIRLARGQLRKAGVAERLENEQKGWTGLSSKRKAFPDGTTRPWTVEELSQGLHLVQKSPWVLK